MLHLGMLPHDRWAMRSQPRLVASTRRTSTAASSRSMSETFSAACDASRPRTVDPVFVLASATIATGAARGTLTARGARSRHRQLAARRARGGALNPELLDPSSGRDECPRRRVAAPRRPRGARAAHDLLHEEPQVGRARPPIREPTASRGHARRLAPSVPGTRAAARHRAPARGRRAPASRRRTRSSRDRHRVARLRDLGRLSGTVASLRQQWAGRAARTRAGPARRERGRAPTVLMADPEALLGRPAERRSCPRHATVLDGHVLSAAYEGPLTRRTAASWEAPR